MHLLYAIIQGPPPHVTLGSGPQGLVSQRIREGLLLGSAGEGRRTGATGGGPEDNVGDAARAAAPACAEAYHAGARQGPHGVGPWPDRAHRPISLQGALAQGGWRSGAGPSGL